MPPSFPPACHPIRAHFPFPRRAQARRLQPLQPGERRYIAEVYLPTGQRVKRACVEDAEGRRAIEAPVHWEDGRRVSPTLHMWSDLGPVGYPGASFLTRGLGLRSTLGFDILHRVACDWEDSIAEAGLRVLRLEAKVVMKLRQGPFASAGHHGQLRAAALRMFAQTSWDSNLWYDILYEPISREFELLQDFGSDAHKLMVWRQLEKLLVHGGKGGTTKSGRWWNWEQNCRGFLKCRSANLLVLLYLGFERKWFKSYRESPLNDQGFEMRADDGDLVGGTDPAGAHNGSVPAGAAGGIDPADGDAPPRASVEAERISMEDARAEVKRRREHCVNTLKFACSKLAADRDCRLMSGVAHVGRSLEVEFHRWIHAFHSQEGVRTWVLQRIKDRDYHFLRACFDDFGSMQFAMKCGFQLAPRFRCDSLT